MKKSLNVSDQERKRIEMETRDQFLQQLWYVVISKQITGSKCRRILCQKVKLFLYLGNVYTHAPATWGIEHESVAIKKYISYKISPYQEKSVASSFILRKDG